MSDEAGARLAEISEQLEETARRLRSGQVQGEEAARLAGECAELASRAAAELDRLVKAVPQQAAPGQEELL
jgi:hypothetical protein